MLAHLVPTHHWLPERTAGLRIESLKRTFYTALRTRTEACGKTRGLYTTLTRIRSCTGTTLKVITLAGVRSNRPPSVFTAASSFQVCRASGKTKPRSVFTAKTKPASVFPGRFLRCVPPPRCLGCRVTLTLPLVLMRSLPSEFDHTRKGSRTCLVKSA